jgi:nicotinamide riboside kinase
MLALTDRQLQFVADALRPLKSEKERAHFLRLLDAQLKIRDVNVQSACERATRAVSTEDVGS